MTPEFKDWRASFVRRYADFEPKSECSSKTVYRYAELDSSRAQDDQRTVQASLSTETPVQHRHYKQVLKHTPEAVDLSRATEGKLPLLWAHQQDDQIGICENVHVHAGVLRARLRFSTSDRGEQIWRDVKAGIIRGISIGCNIEEESFNEDSRNPLMTVTRWMPFEASIVSIPADINAKIGRAMDLGLLNDRPESLQLMDAQRALLTRYDMAAWVAAENETRQAGSAPAFEVFEKRMMAARSLSDVEGLEEELTALESTIDQIDDGGDVCTMRSLAGMEAEFRQQRTHRPNFLSKSKPIMKDQEFSLCRALAAQIDNRAARAANFELETLDQYNDSISSKRDIEGTLVPEDVVFRALNKTTEGTNLVGMAHRPDLFIDALRPRLVTGVMGATILQGLSSDIQIPRKTSDSVATWIEGDGSDSVGQSTPSLDKITMRPQTVGVQCNISRKMLIQGDPASEQLVRETLAYSIAQALDVAALSGDGTGNTPTGILNTSGIGSQTYPNGGAPGFDHIVNMEGALMSANADMGNIGYVTTGLLASQLKRTDIGTDTGRMVWTSTAEAQGVLNGYRARVSNNIPAGVVLLGNWSDLFIGLWSGVDLVVDEVTRAAYGDVIITAMMDCDVAVRHSESFVELKEAP